MVIAVDTSFLFSLYGHDLHTSRALAWMRILENPLQITLLNEFELGNALRFAEFRKSIGKGDAAKFEDQFQIDRASGRLVWQITNLADVFHEAQRLSQQRTLQGGHRGFDILHVANALVMKATHFLTFDHNQKQLAEAEGLIVPNM